MSDGMFKLVMTDDTAQGILGAIRSNNTTQREIRDLISAQQDIMNKICTVIDGSNTMPIMVFDVTYDGTSYALDGITAADITNAINSGVLPVMRIVHEGNAYFIAHSRNTYHPSTGALLSYQFNVDRNNPSGMFGGYNVVIATSKILWDTAAEHTADSRCLVIKATSVDTEDVDEAIAENLSKMLERERGTWKLAQSIAEV